MQKTYPAIFKQSGPWWIGWIAAVPGVTCQERTKEALKETLRLPLQEALQLYRQTAREAIDVAAPSPYARLHARAGGTTALMVASSRAEHVFSHALAHCSPTPL